MPRQYNIRWRPNDEKRLANAVRNYNAKISRLERKNPEMATVLPSRVKLGDIRRDINTRAEYNSYINSLKGFTRRGAEKLVTNRQGAVLTKYELNELRKRVRRINRQRAKEVIIADPSPYRGNMGTVQENNLRPKKFDWQNISKRDLGPAIKSINKQSKFRYNDEKLKNLKENYILGLYSVFNSGADEIVEILNEIPDEVFKENLYKNPLLTIDFMYDPLEAEMKAQAIFDNWSAVLEDSDNW